MLSLPRSSIWRLARNGTIPSVRIGRQVRFDKKAVKKALQIGIS
jgi:excisionase family DNA binding protein